MKYKVDIERAEIQWKAFQPGNSQRGRIFIQEGYIVAFNDTLLKGELVIDMQSIEVPGNRMDFANKQKLEDHLKSIDFFDADIYPEARFSILHIKPLTEEETLSCRIGIMQPSHWVYGELLLKGIRMSLHFPAKIIMDKLALRVEAAVAINRVDWGIDFMLEERYGDKKILPEVEIDVMLVANAIAETVPISIGLNY